MPLIVQLLNEIDLLLRYLNFEIRPETFHNDDLATLV